MEVTPLPFALIVALAAGCVHSPAEVYSSAETDLERLRALQVVEVGALLEGEQIASGNCYGPCPNDPVEPSLSEQAARLTAFADLAEAALLEPLGSCDRDPEIDLAALRSLKIVELGALLLEEAQPEPNCYNLPCPEEQARVDEANCLQVSRLAAIAQATRGL